MSKSFKRYWFIAVPVIMLNIGVTLDHVIAKNNERVFRVSVKKVALESFESTLLQDDDPLNETLRAHWITTNKEGNLDGRISAIEPNEAVTVPIEQLDVALLKDGEKVSKSTTDDDGKFVLKDVEPGVYTLLASGRNGFLAYGVQVLPKLEEFDILEKDGDTQFKPGELKRAYYVSHFNVPQDAVIADELQIDAAAVPPEFSTLKRISQNYLPSASALAIDRDEDDTKATEKASNIKGGFKYALSDSGGFHGRIQPIATSDGKPGKLSEMNVFLIQDDIEAARVAVEENGKFEIENVEPGVYSIVAAGKDGFAALSLELVEKAGDAGDKQGSTTGNKKAYYVSHRISAQAPLETMTIACATGTANLRTVFEEVERSDRERQEFLALRNRGQGLATNVYSNGYSNGYAPGGGFGGGAPSGGFSPGVSGGPFSGNSFGPVNFGPQSTFSGAGPASRGVLGPIVGAFAIAAGVNANSDSNDLITPTPPISPFQPTDALVDPGTL
jgi:hypothetical protein